MFQSYTYTQLKVNSMNCTQCAIFCFFVLIWKGVFRIADNAINILLRFLKALTKVLWKISILITLKSVMRKLGMDDNFKSFVVCPKCHSLYNIEDCIEH